MTIDGQSGFAVLCCEANRSPSITGHINIIDNVYGYVMHKGRICRILQCISQLGGSAYIEGHIPVTQHRNLTVFSDHKLTRRTVVLSSVNQEGGIFVVKTGGCNLGDVRSGAFCHVNTTCTGRSENGSDTHITVGVIRSKNRVGHTAILNQMIGCRIATRVSDNTADRLNSGHLTAIDRTSDHLHIGLYRRLTIAVACRPSNQTTGILTGHIGGIEVTIFKHYQLHTRNIADKCTGTNVGTANLGMRDCQIIDNNTESSCLISRKQRCGCTNQLFAVSVNGYNLRCAVTVG